MPRGPDLRKARQRPHVEPRRVDMTVSAEDRSITNLADSISRTPGACSRRVCEERLRKLVNELLRGQV